MQNGGKAGDSEGKTSVEQERGAGEARHRHSGQDATARIRSSPFFCSSVDPFGDQSSFSLLQEVNGVWIFHLPQGIQLLKMQNGAKAGVSAGKTSEEQERGAGEARDRYSGQDATANIRFYPFGDQSSFSLLQEVHGVWIFHLPQGFQLLKMQNRVKAANSEGKTYEEQERGAGEGDEDRTPLQGSGDAA